MSRIIRDTETTICVETLFLPEVGAGKSGEDNSSDNSIE